jgi:7-keto-8-aminopelargonate synthetase-like enzyme
MRRNADVNAYNETASGPSMPVMQSPPGAETTIDGRRYVYFGGTGYLGLQGHEEVLRAAVDAMGRYGLGSATTRAGFGTTPPILDVERLASQFVGSESALYFASGYWSNHVVTAALADSFDAVFVDRWAHYCVVEAARQTGRPVVAFQHRDADDLRRQLRQRLRPKERPLVMTDGVFAGLGRIAPVQAYCSVLAEYPGSMLSVDDAHALGVLGASGRGVYEHCGVAPSLGGPSGVNDLGDPDADEPSPATGAACPRLFWAGTLSKAVGGYGGIVPGSRRFVERLRRKSRFFSGSSPMPAPVAAATAKALEIVAREPERRQKLWTNVQAVQAGLRQLGLPVDDAPVPIICLSLGSAAHMQHIHDGLKSRGVLVPYMPDYAGLGAEGGLRLAVFATHTPPMLEQLLDALRRLV